MKKVIKIKVEDHAALKKIAMNRGIPMSETISMMIVNYSNESRLLLSTKSELHESIDLILSQCFIKDPSPQAPEVISPDKKDEDQDDF